MRKTLVLTILALLSFSATGFNVTLENSADRNNLEYDILSNYSGFYEDFPQNYEKRESLGSFSFRDKSLTIPDYYLNFTDGNYSELKERKLQLYYASRTGNTTVPLMEEPVYTGNISSEKSTLDVQLSSFRSIYPGLIYTGFTEREVKLNQSGNNTSSNYQTIKGVFNLTEVETEMIGNYTVNPSIKGVQNSTALTVEEVLSSNDSVVFDSNKKPSLVLSVSKNGEIVEEKKAKPGQREIFNLGFSGGEKVFVNGLEALETKGVSGCETVNDNEFYYIVNESSFNTGNNTVQGCFKVENTSETVVDFANTTIDGESQNNSFSNGCAVSITNSTGVELKDPQVQQYEKGICIENSKDTFVQGSASIENSQGIFMNNSSAEVEKIKLKNNNSEIQAQNSSEINMTDVFFDTADISAYAEDINAKNVYNPPPDPNGTVNASQWLNITATDNLGYVEDLGFNYPPLSESDINPLFMYKFDLKNVQTYNNSTKVREWDRTNLSVVKKPVERVIVNPGNIDDFSIFAIYGERIEGNGTGNDPGEGAGDNEDGTGSQGGSPDPGSGAASGGAGGGLRPEPDPEPEPEPIDLNLSLEEYSKVIQQGDTSKINFTVENTGDVEATNIRVEADVRTGWESGIQSFETIDEGDEIKDNILLDVFQNEVPDTYTVPINAKRDGSVLDQETLEVEVVPREKIRDISVVESPTFLDLKGSSTEEVGFLVENTGDYDLENLSIDIRNAENCVKSVGGSFDLQKSERKNIQYELTTNMAEGTCDGVVTFNSENSAEMGVQPIRIEIEEPGILERVTSNVLPIIVLIWTLFTVYWVRRRFYER